VRRSCPPSAFLRSSRLIRFRRLCYQPSDFGRRFRAMAVETVPARLSGSHSLSLRNAIGPGGIAPLVSYRLCFTTTGLQSARRIGT